MRWLVALLLLTGAALAQSQRQPSAQDAQKAEQTTKPEQRGTQDQPLTVNVVPTAEQKAEAEKKDAEAKIKETAKAADDHNLVEYTGNLVVVGIVTFAIFILQLAAFIAQACYIRRSVREMGLTTKAMIAVGKNQLRYGHKIERAYLSGGGAKQVRRRHLGTHTDNSQIGKVLTVDLGFEETKTGFFAVCINNYGKTPGELFWVGIGFCDASSVPDQEPVYEFVYRHDWIQPGDRGRPIFPQLIPTDRPATAVFGRFYYRDIFGGKHSCGFINKIEGPRQSDPLLAPPRIYRPTRRNRQFQILATRCPVSANVGGLAYFCQVRDNRQYSQ